jgi:solute carrier family 25 carnitine/acylcarnitine transporter 20/29
LAEITFAGAFSAIPTTLFMAPSERVKVLMQIQGQGGEQKYKGPLDVVRQLYKEGGVRSIWRGTGATLLRDSPGSAAYFVAYELIKKNLTPEGARPEDLSFGAVLFAGGKFIRKNMGFYGLKREAALTLIYLIFYYYKKVWLV